MDIRNAVVIKGSLPGALLYRVLGWCVSHTKELMENWNLAKAGKPLKWIDWSID